MIKPAYSVSFLLSINIYVCQNGLYFPKDSRSTWKITHCSMNLVMCSFKLWFVSISRLLWERTGEEKQNILWFSVLLCRIVWYLPTGLHGITFQNIVIEVVGDLKPEIWNDK